MQPGTSTLNGQVPTTGFSVTEAAQVLGVSPNTVRARIKAGRLRAERAQRPQGEVIRVYLDAEDLPAPGTSEPPAQVPATGTSQDVPPGTSQIVPAQQVAALGRLVQEAIAPIERERDRLLDLTIQQAERIGRLEAELDQLTATSLLRPISSDSERVSGEPTQTPATTPHRASWWRFWQRATA